MNNHIAAVLAAWHPQRKKHRWVLGVVTATQGSSYRKAGAMMLLSELGQCLGLLSGGCLERALMAEAKRALAFNRPRDITFDATESADVAWQYGLGCGGKVSIRLLPLSEENHFLCLEELHALLESGARTWLGLPLAADMLAPDLRAQLCHQPPRPGSASQPPHQLWIDVRPQVRLVVFGAGVDVIPVAALAANLGWRVTLIDHRVGLARPEDFPQSTTWLKDTAAAPAVQRCLRQADAALVMTHNIALDGAALQALMASQVRYIGLLGPAHRKHRVITEANIDEQQLPVPIDGPMGAPLGGDLPESVALSALSECHRVLHQLAQPQAEVAPAFKVYQ